MSCPNCLDCRQPDCLARTEYSCLKLPDGEIIHGQVQYTCDPDGNVIQTLLSADGTPAPSGATKTNCPQQVMISNPSEIKPTATAPANITLQGQDCTGTAAPVTGVAGQLVEVVQRAGQALAVRLCNPADRELVVRCDKATGNPVIGVVDVSTATPTTTWWDVLAGAAYAGNPATDLENCGGTAGYDIEQTDGCAAGVGVTRVRLFNPKDGTLFQTAWLDSITAAVVAAPAAWTEGNCAQERQMLIFGPLQVCRDPGGGNPTEPWQVREKVVYNQATATVVSTTLEFSQDGLTWTTTAPAGTITAGPCDRAWSMQTFEVCIEDPAGVFTTWIARNEVLYKLRDGTWVVGADLNEFSKDGGQNWTPNPGGTIRSGRCVQAVPTLQVIGPTPICVNPGGGNPPTQALMRQTLTYSSAGVLVSTVTEYSTDAGVTWSLTAPTGTLTQGPCDRQWSMQTFDVCVENPAGVFTPWIARNELLYNADTGTWVVGADLTEFSSDGGQTWVQNVAGTVRSGSCQPQANSVKTAVRVVTGDTLDAADLPPGRVVGLTIMATGGALDYTDHSGTTSPVPKGATLSWSADPDTDSIPAGWSVTTAAGISAIVQIAYV